MPEGLPAEQVCPTSWQSEALHSINMLRLRKKLSEVGLSG